MVRLPVCPLRRVAAASVMQQSRGAHDLKISAFDCCQALRRVIDAFHVIESVDGIMGGIPGASSFQIEQFRSPVRVQTQGE